MTFLMNVVIYVFILIWLIVALFGVVNPKGFIELFPSLSRIIGVNSGNIPDKALVFFRFAAIFLLTFGVMILYLMTTEKLHF